MVDISIHHVVSVQTEVTAWRDRRGKWYYSLEVEFTDHDGTTQSIVAYSKHYDQRAANPFSAIDPEIAEVIGGGTDDD